MSVSTVQKGLNTERIRAQARPEPANAPHGKSLPETVTLWQFAYSSKVECS